MLGVGVFINTIPAACNNFGPSIFISCIIIGISTLLSFLCNIKFSGQIHVASDISMISIFENLKSVKTVRFKMMAEGIHYLVQGRIQVIRTESGNGSGNDENGS
ncbi:hypothetical protein GQ457_06G015840 [Hibiscus cannabinus]